jgi:imidazole glycerol phosphate synthase subunit HisF
MSTDTLPVGALALRVGVAECGVEELLLWCVLDDGVDNPFVEEVEVEEVVVVVVLASGGPSPSNANVAR